MTIYNITTGKTYESIAAAARATGVSASSIARASQKETRSAGGYQWARASTAAEKRAASRAAHKAAGALSEAQRERREWQRARSEARIKERKAAEKRAKEQAAAEERARKAEERARKAAERERKQEYQRTARSMREVNRRLRSPDIAPHVREALTEIVKQITDGDKLKPKNFEDWKADDLRQVRDFIDQKLRQMDVAELGLDPKQQAEIDRLSYLFGLSPKKALDMQDELDELLKSFGYVRTFLKRVQGDAGYKAFDIGASYRDVVNVSDKMTPENIMQLVVKINQHALDKNEQESDWIKRIYTDWRAEVSGDKQKQADAQKRRKPLKLRR